MHRQSRLRVEQMSDQQPQQRCDPVAANSVRRGPRSAQPAPRSTCRGSNDALVEGGFRAARRCVFSRAHSLSSVPPVWHFISFLPQLKRPNRSLHASTGHRTELPEFPSCHLVAMNQLVEAKRIDLTSVVPDKARPDMFEKIGQSCLVIADEKGPVRPALRFLGRRHSGH